jgi:hypothetical protein
VPYLVLGVFLLAGVLFAARWFVNADPKAVVRALKWVGVPVVVAFVVFLGVTGRLAFAFMLAPVLLPWLLRLRSAATSAKNYSRMNGGSASDNVSGQTSTVETRVLRMVLDHDSGAMSGRVKEGPYAGRELSSMTLAELIELLNYCGMRDGQSAKVLETYLDRSQSDWRDHVRTGGRQGASGGFGPGGLSRDESYKILGLEPGASVEEIKSAYHRLMSALHPDKGGSTYLAAKLNEAKDVLLHEH